MSNKTFKILKINNIIQLKIKKILIYKLKKLNQSTNLLYFQYFYRKKNYLI